MTPRFRPAKRVFKRTSESVRDSRQAVDEELSFHLDMAVRELEETGVDRNEARRRAEEEFGDLEFTRDYCAEQAALRDRKARNTMGWDQMLQDVRISVRTLRKNWSYTAVVVATLAFGIAANTLIFSVMNPYFFRALPYQDADRLVQLGQVGEEWDGYRFSLGQIADWEQRTDAFSGIASYWYNTRNLTGPEGAVRVMATFVTDDMFDVLGTQPLVGRTIRPGEGGPAGADVVVISHGLWESRYGSDPSLLGRTIEIDGAPHTVVGVMGPDFGFPFNEVRLWLPVREDVASQGRERSNYLPVARLRDDWTVERARAELNAIHAEFASVYPDEEGLYSGVSVKPIREALNFAWTELSVSFTVLLIAVAFVLLIACVNVASLTLARASTRSREVAVRAAIGAARGRLVRQFLTESVVLAALGGALGIAIAYWVASTFGSMIPEGLYRVGEVSIDGNVLAFTVAVTFVTPLVFGLLPALASTRADLASTLRERDGSGRPRALRGRRLLVVAEVALAIALITGTGLTVRSFSQISNVDLGFDADRLLFAELTPSESAYAAGDEVNGYFDRAAESISTLRGVLAVGQTAWLPLNHETAGIAVSRPGEEPALRADWPGAIRGIVSSDYFETMSIPLVRGRTFGAMDGPDDPDVVVVSEMFGAQFFPGENPVGQMISVLSGDDILPMQIVGVVGDIQHSDLQGPRQPYLYRPISQLSPRRRFVVVATSVAPARTAPELRRTLQELDPALPFDIRLMEEVVRENTLPWALGSVFLGVFGVGALLLASLGIYGVISYSVSQRRREMGIRIAMGASAAQVRAVVVSDGLRLTGAGIAIGLLLALAVGQLMASILFGVSPFDPLTLGGVLMLFLVVATVASLMPAVRAGRVDPLQVLRTE